MRIPVLLALKDLRHDWLASLCFVAALVGILTPLLIILALKDGVIGTMVGRLVDDPSNRELIAVGAGSHDAAFFEAMRARPDVEFIIPATRSINTSANAIRNPEARKLARAIPLVPSAEGDPLIDGPPVSVGQVYVTEALRDELELAGGPVEMVIGREIDGTRQTARAEFEVIGIVASDLFARPAVFLSLADLMAVERFRDDPTLTPEGWRDPRPEPERYASFRLYVADLDDLDAVEAELDAGGVRVRPRAENATLLLLFRTNLNILYTVIAGLAVLGFWAAMAANLRGMVERQRVSFSLLRLIGLEAGGRRLIPMVQSVVLVMLGIAVTLVVVLPAVRVINAVFSSAPGEFVASLGWVQVLGTCGLGLATALTASLWARAAIDGIESDEVLRNA